MCNRCGMALGRRKLVGSLGAALSAVVLGAAASAPPSQAHLRLARGNSRYVDGRLDPKDFTAGRAARSAGQAPFAALLSCSDSRVAPELIFDCHPGELFVVRNAGNCVEPFGVASLEYATTVLGVRTILMMGHSGCGAVKAAIADAETGAVPPGSLPGVMNNIQPAMAAVRNLGSRTASPDAVVGAHAANGVRSLQEGQPVLSPLVQSGHLEVVGGVYNIADGRVAFL